MKNLIDIENIQDYLNTDFEILRKDLFSKSLDWEKIGQKKALNTFKKAAIRVPAYKKFLKKQKIDPKKIKTFSDFEKVPFTDKSNYIDMYPLEELLVDGNISNSQMINSSSGTTGNPYFWPISTSQIVQGAIIHEIILNNSFKFQNQKSLLVICFGMGTWIAGSYTLLSTQLVEQKNYPLTTITPGFNKEETIRILKLLGPKFDQVIIAGIPTFVKDLIEQWVKDPQSKKIKKYRFLFAGEGFSESWREYILNLVGSYDYYNDAVSIYGAAETAIMGFETPESIQLRKKVNSSLTLRKELFSDERLPTIHNFISFYRFFESFMGDLLLTADRDLALIRYNLHDQGGVIYSGEKSNLPIVYNFGRGKFMATLYGVNIYPENIREVLLDKTLNTLLSGRFKIETKYDSKQNQYLEFRVELNKNLTKVPDNLNQLVANTFYAQVRELNSEYKKMSEEYKDKAKPVTYLHEFGDPNLFPEGVLKKTS